MRKDKVFFFFLVFFWLIIIYNIFISSVPIPTNSSYIKKSTIFNITPQGWGFFTKNPREEEMFLYKINSKNEISLFTKTNNAFEFFLGASRKNRFIGIETEALVSKLDKNAWVKGDIKFYDFKQDIKTDTISLNFATKDIQGDFFIVRKQRVPWAWGRSYKKIIMPYEYTKIYVK